jgi:hypothetical protein
MHAIDQDDERIVRYCIEGPTVMELVRFGVSGEVYLPQVRNIAAGLNTNYYPTSFILHDGLLWYADYECDVYRLVNRIL